MIERVVVAWDGSPAATSAADWAATRQRGEGALELVRVVDEVHPPADWETTAGTVRGASDALDREAERLTARYPHLRVRTAVRIARREDELLAHSNEHTLLVVGTEERVGPKLRFRFSLAVRLAARSSGPVAVVPLGYRGSDAGPVVVGVDGSAACLGAARLAAEEASRRGIPLVVVHAWWEATDWEAVLPLDAGVHATFEQIHRRVLDASVDAIVDLIPGLEIERRLVHGPRAEVLLAAAEDAFELVVGKHGRVLARDVLLGSVSHNLLLDTWVPTIVSGAVTDATADGVVEATVVSRRVRP